MSFYSDASLVLIPSGYKDQKIYSAVPTDGSGDMSFSRASSATRVASNGLIEKVRTNVALRSQSFATSAVWSTVSGTITDNAGTAPDGTNTASKIVAGNADPYVYQSLTPSAQVTLSCYVKGIGSSIGKTARIICNADLTDVTMDGTWQRISVTHTPSGTEIYGLEIPNPAVSGDEVLLWGFQVEYGDIATDYIATTSAAVSVGPVSGLPRLDYLNSTCPRLLLEPQRTNLQTNSENATGTNWGNAIAVDITANQTASPDGYVSADLIAATPASVNHRFEQSFAATSGTAYTLSYFAKANTNNQCYIVGFADNSVFATQTAIFNLTNGTILSNTGGGTANIVNYGNGWYRVSLTITAGATATGYWGNGLAKNGSITFTSDGTSIYMWGLQLEAGAYATSYIPTLGTSVTRVADAAFKTGISSLIGQTEGTIFVEINFDLGVIAPDNSRIQLSDGTTSNWIFIAFPNGSASNLIRIYANGSSGSMSEYSTNSIVSGVNKIAYGYKSGSFVLYVNGVQEASSSSTITIPTCSRIDLTGSSPAVINALERTNYNQALLFKTRLTNESLASLTSL